MKKTFFILPFAASMLLLSACFGGTPSLEDRINNVETNGKNFTYEGVLERAVFDAYQPGTHLLKMGDDDALLLQSAVVDLNRYLDEGVIVSGVDAEVVGDAKRVLNVMEIKYADGARNDEVLSYENKSLGFRFNYPASWKLLEEEGIQFTSGEGETEVVMAEVKIYNDTEDLDALTAKEEEGEGTAVTIGAQRALRFSDDIFFHVYIPNPPQKKVYRVTFPPFPAADDEGRQPFYDLLRSFELIYASATKNEKCGGLQKLECAEGYRCESESAGKYAEGICVSLTAGASTGNCPYIAPPACTEYRIAEYTKMGCPSLYECVKGGAALESPSATKTNDSSDSEDSQAESRIMADGIEDEDDEELEEDASGESDEENAHDIPSANDVTREYRDIRQEFVMSYPKSWYYASFGAINGTFLTAGFSDQPLEEIDEAIITVRIMDAVPKKADAGRYFLSTRRDLNSFFVVEGTPELKNVVEAMLKSITDERN